MSDSPFAKYTSGARLERQLRKLRAGDCFRLSRDLLSEITVPADPLDRQTPEYLANWFHARMPFYCTLHHDVVNAEWDICRPRSDGNEK